MGFSLLGFLGLGGGGNSNTAQTSSQATHNTNSQTTQGDGSQSFTNSNGNSLSQTTYNTTTDYSAVGGGLNIASQALQSNGQLAQAMVNASSKDFTTGLGFAEHAMQGVFNTNNTALQSAIGAQQNATSAIKDAFSTSKAGEQKVLVGAGLAVVAIVAVMALKKG